MIKDYVKYDGHDVEPVHYFFQAEEGQVNLIYAMPYQKHCFIILRTLIDQELFYLDLQEYQQ